MKEFLKALSGRTEFLVVVLGAFGVFLLSNLVLLIDPVALSAEAPITNEGLQGLIVYELVVMAILGAFLRARNWTLERFGISADLRDTVIGVGLVAIVYVITTVIELIAAGVAPEMLERALKMQRVQGPLDAGTVVIASLVNSVFEEVFVCP